MKIRIRHCICLSCYINILDLFLFYFLTANCQK
nr:MAG TPA: hypothetical protein [Caudoviricetes sp.]